MRTILFDFDGTVADTLPLIFTAFRSTFQQFLQEHYTDEQIVALFGPTETGILQNKLPSHAHDNALAHFYRVYTDEHSRVQNPENIRSMLDELHAAGIQMGIVTGKGRKSADISLREWGLDSYFSVVITGDEVTHPKPHPEGIFTAMNQLGATPAETIFVGDSDADVLAGRAAGLRTVGVDWLLVTQKSGKFDPEPDYHFTDVRAFTDWILGR
ncbi:MULTISPECIES: HAD family hydrolase [Brevibacillus]|uniref:HAD family hydrolase n=1 Tax=Brevibacillus TaxID=55080 RepID=UPI000D10CB32|nr:MULTISPECIES: HAD family hydrolase [Brevibacillus]PSJ59221.1 haloacid dehalogenase [Brevibacillus brevis]RED27329.1 phosphoglycolate phosphatase/pyrophosphatase PpaX [Brevibacillus brevis]TQK53541.1 phosphoglycolate phosphatase/pyrophosphatase PpaX [Brevibacillus sp. AG162]VEF91181.1 Pyrophosphatase ppaX [Brevibacillus brevis]GEC93536.1 pyrophosphatase PpaX [Brevibacillus brevis]